MPLFYIATIAFTFGTFGLSFFSYSQECKVEDTYQQRPVLVYFNLPDSDNCPDSQHWDLATSLPLKCTETIPEQKELNHPSSCFDQKVMHPKNQKNLPEETDLGNQILTFILLEKKPDSKCEVASVNETLSCYEIVEKKEPSHKKIYSDDILPGETQNQIMRSNQYDDNI